MSTNIFCPAPQRTVKQFREILLWPLRLIQEPRKQHREDREDWSRRFQDSGSAWQPLTDPYDLKTTANGATRYAEFVYFHPFVQRFLYSRQDRDTASPLRVFHRSDIKYARVQLYPATSRRPLDLRVERLHLYIFDTGIAILAMEVVADDCTMVEVQDLVDQFRRAYPPYWRQDDSAAGHCPVRVEWLGCDGRSLEAADYDKRDDYLKFVDDNRSALVARHWCYLLDPLIPYTVKADPKKIRYQQIVDERIPYMAYLAVENPLLIRRGEMIRLAFADSSDPDARELPYASGFLEDFEPKHCYGRFWEPAASQDKTTLFMCCGYSFTMVGDNQSGFYINREDGALAHFRHHYFQMGLIAHFHKAFLLMILDRLSEAVKEEPDRNKIEEIHKDTLRFSNRYWFPEISNQLQARELFQLWSEQLGTQKLFERVNGELQKVKEYLDIESNKKLNDVITRLTGVGVLVGTLALTTNLLPIDKKDVPRFLIVALSAFLIVFGIGYYLLPVI